MRRLPFLMLLVPMMSFGQPSYWFQQWQRKPNAQQAQEFFMLPGANMTFTYANNRVYLNAAGGGPGGNLQLFGDVTSPLTALPNVTATLANVGAGGVGQTKLTWNAKGLVTAGTMATLASADYANQGTTTTLLHGNNAGNPSWGAVNLGTDVTGDLSVTHLNGGTDADVNHYWRGDGTWALPPTGFGLDIRTNAYNTFLGTNFFTNSVWVGGRFGLQFTNFGNALFNGYGFVYSRVPSNGPTTQAGVNLMFGPNLASPPSGGFKYDGIAIEARSHPDPGLNTRPIEIRGNPVYLANDANGPIVFDVIATHIAQFNGYGNLLVDKTGSPAQLFSAGAGGIWASNFIHTLQYLRAVNGLVVNSNSWTRVPSFPTATGSDVFNCGDIWIVSSNGFPYVLSKRPDCSIITNSLSTAQILSLPNASFSCSSSNIPFAPTNGITLDTIEHAGDSQGIALDNTAWFTAGQRSKIWITNAGDYMITFSAMWAKASGAPSNGDIWLTKNGANVDRTSTIMTIQNNATNVMTVNYFVSVTTPSYFNLIGASTDNSGHLVSIPAITTPFTRPIAPAIIVTVNMISR